MTWLNGWKRTEPLVRLSIATALRGSIGGIDVDDVVQEIALQSWLRHQAGEPVCSPSYWRVRAKWFVLDQLRRHRKTRPLLDSDDPIDERQSCIRMAKHDVEDLLGSNLARLLCCGLTASEAARVLRVSKATVSRAISKARYKVMSSKLSVKEFGSGFGDTRKFRLYAGDVWVASVVMDKETRQVTMRSRNTGATVEQVHAVIDAAYGTPPDVNMVKENNKTLQPAETGEEGKVVEEMKKAKKAKKVEQAKKSRKAKSAIPAGFLCGDIKGADFPPTLAKWREMCGGEGHCLGGSGFKVGSRFKPGWDAKLKSALKQKGTANAKAIAAELGWSNLIKWD